MVKVNKKLILLLILVLVIGVLSGCQKKTPEGVSQEFYDDMIFASEDLIKTIKTTTNTDLLKGDILQSKGAIIVDDYYYNKTDNLTLVESSILESLNDLYFDIALYYRLKSGGVETSDFSDIEENIKNFNNLMGIDVDIN